MSDLWYTKQLGVLINTLKHSDLCSFVIYISVWCLFAASHVPSIDVSTAVGITFSITFIMALSLGVLVTVCIFKTRSKTTSPHHYTPNAPNEVVGINQKIDVIPLDSNVAYGRVK